MGSVEMTDDPSIMSDQMPLSTCLGYSDKTTKTKKVRLG